MVIDLDATIVDDDGGSTTVICKTEADAVKLQQHTQKRGGARRTDTNGRSMYVLWSLFAFACAREVHTEVVIVEVPKPPVIFCPADSTLDTATVKAAAALELDYDIDCQNDDALRVDYLEKGRCNVHRDICVPTATVNNVVKPVLEERVRIAIAAKLGM